MPPILHEQCVRTSTECSPFWGTVSPIVAPQMFKKQSGMLTVFYGFFVDFSVISRPGGYPLENVSACKLWREHKNYFCMFLRRPRGGFGTPLEPFWLPWACLGATLGATLAPKVNIKGRKKTLLVHVRAGSNFKYEKAGARTLIMWLNHSKY